MLQSWLLPNICYSRCCLLNSIGNSKYIYIYNFYVVDIYANSIRIQYTLVMGLVCASTDVFIFHIHIAFAFAYWKNAVLCEILGGIGLAE